MSVAKQLRTLRRFKMKITIGDVHFYKLDLDTEDEAQAQKMAIEWLLGADGNEKSKHNDGACVVREIDGDLYKIEEKYHE